MGSGFVDSGLLFDLQRDNYSTCTVCGELKHKSSFSLVNKVSTARRKQCKKCRCKMEYRKQLERLILREPNKYKDCVNKNCDHIHHVSRLMCPKCRWQYV